MTAPFAQKSVVRHAKLNPQYHGQTVFPDILLWAEPTYASNIKCEVHPAPSLPGRILRKKLVVVYPAPPRIKGLQGADCSVLGLR